MTINEELILEEVLPRHLYNSNVYTYAAAFIKAFKMVEKDIIKVRDGVFISTATQSNLDIIAKLFGLRRIQGESDSNFRNRILTYYQSVIKGGSVEGLKGAIASITGVSLDGDLEVTDTYYYKFREVYDFLNGTDYTGTGVTNDTANYVETYDGASIKITSPTVSGTRTATNATAGDITKTTTYDALSFWVKSTSVSDLSSFKLTITDDSAGVLEYEITDFSTFTNNEWTKITIPFSLYDIDYDNISSIAFATTGESDVVTYIDYMVYEEYVPYGTFSITIDVGDETNLNKYDNIPTIMTLMKPVGITFDEFIIKSANGIFRYNLSDYNGLDVLL